MSTFSISFLNIPIKKWKKYSQIVGDDALFTRLTTGCNFFVSEDQITSVKHTFNIQIKDLVVFGSLTLHNSEKERAYLKARYVIVVGSLQCNNVTIEYDKYIKFPSFDVYYKAMQPLMEECDDIAPLPESPSTPYDG